MTIVMGFKITIQTADRVHKIQTDDQFIRRFESDRRVFVFNHKQNNLQPLMLLNIALTRGIASSINDIVGKALCIGLKKC